MAYKNFQGNVMDYKEIYESWLNDERLCGEAKAELEAVKDQHPVPQSSPDYFSSSWIKCGSYSVFRRPCQ